jgi:hypothetical protein
VWKRHFALALAELEVNTLANYRSLAESISDH